MARTKKHVMLHSTRMQGKALFIGMLAGLILGLMLYILLVYPGDSPLTSASSVEIIGPDGALGATGRFLVEKGKITKSGKKDKGNPHYGALKGTVTYVIQDDDGTIIDQVENTNRFLLFTSTGNVIDNYAFIATGEFNLSNVDSDAAEVRCDSKKYKTLVYYYDTNNNSEMDEGEFDVFETTPDDAGCFASKLPPGIYDLYLGDKIPTERGKDKDWWEET